MNGSIFLYSLLILIIIVILTLAFKYEVRWRVRMGNLMTGRKTKITKLTYLSYAIVPIIFIIIALLFLTRTPLELNSKIIEIIIGTILLTLGLIQVNPLTRIWSIKFFNQLSGNESEITSLSITWALISGIIEVAIGGYTLYSNLILNSPFLIKFILEY